MPLYQRFIGANFLYNLTKMRPPRVELGSREPESHVRSITLRARQQILYYLKQKGIASII